MREPEKWELDQMLFFLVGNIRKDFEGVVLRLPGGPEVIRAHAEKYLEAARRVTAVDYPAVVVELDAESPKIRWAATPA